MSKLTELFEIKVIPWLEDAKEVKEDMMIELKSLSPGDIFQTKHGNKGKIIMKGRRISIKAIEGDIEGKIIYANPEEKVMLLRNEKVFKKEIRKAEALIKRSIL